MSNMNFNCDVCGREMLGYTFVNGMKFCAKCYQETFGASKDWQLLDKDKTIAEQQQLIKALNGEVFINYKLPMENAQLKQQLHDLPKKIVEEIKENFDWRQCCEIRKYYDQQYIWFNYVAFNDFLETILKKFGGENE